jgi:hypothetical protein
LGLDEAGHDSPGVASGFHLQGPAELSVEFQDGAARGGHPQQAPFGGMEVVGKSQWGQAIVIKYFFLLFSLRFISMISTLLEKFLSRCRSFSTFITPRLMVIGSRLKC